MNKMQFSSLVVSYRPINSDSLSVSSVNHWHMNHSLFITEKTK